MKINKDLRELARLFLKLGSTAFGGPAVHISLFENEVVTRRQWMTHEHFLDLAGATNLIPGPNSTEMAMHIGRERAGWRGMITAGLCFIFPAVSITFILAWLYSKYGMLPEVEPYIYGIKPAVLAIILRAVIPLARKAVKSTTLAVLGAIALAACLEGINDIMVMLGAGFLALILSFQGDRTGKDTSLKSWIIAAVPVPWFTLATLTGGAVFLLFLKIGIIWFGSGYVLFGLLDNELVARGLLTRPQLLDAIAAGQITPGPLFSSVTFVGWQMKGFTGALMATAGIFLPAVLLVGLLNPLIPKMRNSKSFSAFLDAVNVASVAVIIAVTLVMGKETLINWRTIVIALASLVTVFSFKKINSIFILSGSAAVGFLLTLI
jgi:chromate transporter